MTEPIETSKAWCKSRPEREAAGRDEPHYANRRCGSLRPPSHYGSLHPPSRRESLRPSSRCGRLRPSRRENLHPSSRRENRHHPPPRNPPPPPPPIRASAVDDIAIAPKSGNDPKNSGPVHHRRSGKEQEIFQELSVDCDQTTLKALELPDRTLPPDDQREATSEIVARTAIEPHPCADQNQGAIMGGNA
jgi:hypothetical protein